jgi:hypothetical protein
MHAGGAAEEVEAESEPICDVPYRARRPSESRGATSARVYTQAVFRRKEGRPPFALMFDPVLVQIATPCV